jgi:hypothetical protein
MSIHSTHTAKTSSAIRNTWTEKAVSSDQMTFVMNFFPTHTLATTTTPVYA